MRPDTTLASYLDALAGGTAAPGGGSAAAATGAMGAALVCMVCNLTLGRKKYAAVEAEVRTILARAEAQRAVLTQLVDEDPAAYGAVMEGYRLPKETETERAARNGTIQAAMVRATLAALATARACAEVIELCQAAVRHGNPNAAGDASAGAACAQAGLKTAALNVSINLPTVDDETFVTACRSELAEIMQKLSVADAVQELTASRAA